MGLAVRYGHQMSEPSEPPKLSSPSGRNAYDAAVEILGMLGRAAPAFVFAAGFLYAVYQIYAVDQSKERAVAEARTEAAKEQSQQIAELNNRIRENDESLEKLRKNQTDGLEQLLKLTQTITASIAQSQTDLLKQRDELFTARADSEKAQRELADARKITQSLATERADLEKQAASAKDIMDAAARILNYLEDPGPPLTKRNELSRRFENDDETQISVEASGKYFYGAYRLPGDEVGHFLNWLNNSRPELAKPLLDAGGGQAAEQGTDAFKAKWLTASDNPAFTAIQAAWIDDQRYEPFVERLAKNLSLADSQAFKKRSVALQAVLWSVINQHGASNRVVADAWRGLHPETESDLVLICKIYAVRRNNTAQYFPKRSTQTYTLLKARYRFEQEDALRMLKEGTNMKDDPRCEQ
jgi:hypothetical protein